MKVWLFVFLWLFSLLTACNMQNENPLEVQQDSNSLQNFDNSYNHLENSYNVLEENAELIGEDLILQLSSVEITQEGEDYFMEVDAYIQNISSTSILIRKPLDASFQFGDSNCNVLIKSQDFEEIQLALAIVDYLYPPGTAFSQSDFLILESGESIKIPGSKLEIPKIVLAGEPNPVSLPSGTYLISISYFHGSNINYGVGEHMSVWVGLIESNYVEIMIP